MANENANVAYMDPPLEVINVTAVAAVTQGDLVLFGKWLGVALNTAAIGENLGIDFAPRKRVNAVSAVSGVGAALGDDVYYNFTTGVFAPEYSDGYYFVGNVTQVKDSGNCFQFEKVHSVVSGVADLYSAAVKVAVTTIDAETDYSTTGKTVVIPEGAQMLMLRVHTTATHTSGSVTLYNGITAAHTAAVMATAGAVTAVTAGVVQSAFTVGTDAITLKTNSLGDAGIVQIWYI